MQPHGKEGVRTLGPRLNLGRLTRPHKNINHVHSGEFAMTKGFLVAAAALVSSAPASAGIIYEETGTLSAGSEFNHVLDVPFTPGGTIRAKFELSGSDVYIFANFFYQATFSLCDHDYERPECGTNESQFNFQTQRITDRLYEVVAPIRPDAINYFAGTGLLYWEYNVQNYDPETGEWGPVDYRLTISDSAVPEPASWALMIGGLGLVGSMARRRDCAVSRA